MIPKDPVHEALPAPLEAGQLWRPTRLDASVLEDPGEGARPADDESAAAALGQDRARQALRDAMDIPQRGYNVFLLGPPGVGKREVVEAELRARAAREPTPDDWCYVNDFEAQHRPRALRLAPGDGVRLQAEMRGFVEELRAALPALLESEEFRTRAEQIDTRFGEEQESLFVALGAESSREGIALVHSPAGFSFAPMREGKVMSPEAFEALPEAEREQLQSRLSRLQERLQHTVRQAQQLHKEKRSAIRELSREMTLRVVGTLTDEVKARFSAAPAVLAHLDATQADVLAHIDSFRRSSDGDTGPGPLAAMEESDLLRRYEINVLVGDSHAPAGAPVVFEDNPSFPNLMGRIENVARLGMLMTDFSMIQPGALHRANGGYLVLDALKVLTRPLAWDGLKRVLSSGTLQPETMGQSLGFATTVALEPEPIPVSVKVVLTGSRMVHELLLALDPEFEALFKVAGDFEDDVERSDGHETRYARLMGTLARRDGLPPLSPAAAARLVEQAAREAEDSGRLSARLAPVRDLMREAGLLTRRAGAASLAREHVEQALEARRWRIGRVRERLLDAALRGDLLIDTTGTAVGQVNGLSVSSANQCRFGHPTRITATTRLGDGEVIDIEREVLLGGPIHSKGVLTLAAYLASRYASDRPHCLAATLSFEQTYGTVEGDSASLAELVALTSSLAQAPVHQGLAVTGSVNQHGQVQPVGGINEKIEGFFDLCDARGLTGSQGVVMPAGNARHLMLERRVVDAVAAGRFAIHPVTHVDQALALLTGLPAGQPAADGRFPEGSLNARVAARLLELSRRRQAFSGKGRRVRSGRDHG